MNRREFLALVAGAPVIAALKPWQPAKLSTTSGWWTISFASHPVRAVSVIDARLGTSVPLTFRGHVDGCDVWELPGGAKVRYGRIDDEGATPLDL